MTIVYREDGAKMDKICISNLGITALGMGEEAEKLCPATGFKDLEKSPTSYRLGQNCPNPYDPNTTIEYNISQSGGVKIKLFNISGKKLLNIIDKIQTAGNKKINVNLILFKNKLYPMQVWD